MQLPFRVVIEAWCQMIMIFAFIVVMMVEEVLLLQYF